MTEHHPMPANAVAVVGMALRVPGASTLDEFWRNLRGGVESITTFTDEELLAAGATPEDIARPGFVRAFGALDGVADFDARVLRLRPARGAATRPAAPAVPRVRVGGARARRLPG